MPPGEDQAPPQAHFKEKGQNIIWPESISEWEILTPSTVCGGLPSIPEACSID